MWTTVWPAWRATCWTCRAWGRWWWIPDWWCSRPCPCPSPSSRCPWSPPHSDSPPCSSSSWSPTCRSPASPARTSRLPRCCPHQIFGKSENKSFLVSVTFYGVTFRSKIPLLNFVPEFLLNKHDRISGTPPWRWLHHCWCHTSWTDSPPFCQHWSLVEQFWWTFWNPSCSCFQLDDPSKSFGNAALPVLTRFRLIDWFDIRYHRWERFYLLYFP